MSSGRSRWRASTSGCRSSMTSTAPSRPDASALGGVRSALAARWGDTRLVAALALGVVLVVPLIGEAMQLAIAIVLVLAGGAVAVAVAVARAASAASLERFRLLAGVAEVADRAAGRHEELVSGVLDLLVPTP